MRNQWRFGIALAFVTAVALVRVGSTHRVFSEVLDEPAHLSAGYRWFEGEYTIDASHPPLARILGALPLRLAGYPNPPGNNMVDVGNDLLYHGNRYVKTLARVRIGNLLLLAVGIIATALWARRAFSDGVALAAAALLSTLPPVLGHAGVLTTDLAALTAIPLALLALDLFLEHSTPKRGMLLGLALGIGLLAKFSFFVFFPICAVFALMARWPKRMDWKNGAMAIGITVLVVWAGYRFDFGTPKENAGDHAVHVFDVAAPGSLRPFALWAAANLPIPAPAFAVGLGMVKAHDSMGHASYLFGKVGDRGWWYYFPVVFFYKTPLPFLVLALWGAALLIAARHRFGIALLLMALGILGMSMTSAINIGVRHILPMYAPLAIVAGYATVEIWRRATDAFGRVALCAVLAWLFIGVAVRHPDYLGWFNEAAGPNPGQIAVDSNLDWGQDTLRLERTLRELNVQALHLDVMTNVRLDRHGIVAIPFNPVHKASGWLAVSETPLAMKRGWGMYAWLRDYRPAKKIGTSIRLYAIP